MSKKRKKMTAEEHMKQSLLINFGPIFNSKWGAPKCSICKADVDLGRDMLINNIMCMTPDERDPLGTASFMAHPVAYESISAAVILIDSIHAMDMEGLTPCSSCGWLPVNQFQSTTEDQP